jgi:hypothetical protein
LEHRLEQPSGQGALGQQAAIRLQMLHEAVPSATVMAMKLKSDTGVRRLIRRSSSAVGMFSITGMPCFRGPILTSVQRNE